MKKILSSVLVIIFLFGCSRSNSSIAGALNLRQKLLKGEGCSFIASIAADYTDHSYCFTVNCNAQKNGCLAFSIESPDSISGINGTISEDGAKLVFDEQALLFEPLMNGQVSPAIAPWLMVRAITGGYIQSEAKIKNGYEYYITDSYQSETFQILLTVDDRSNPVYCEIIWHDSRVLSIEISNYRDL